jgi:hypothetical protein
VSALPSALKFALASVALQFLIFVIGVALLMAATGIHDRIAGVAQDLLRPMPILMAVLYAAPAALLSGWKLHYRGSLKPLGLFAFIACFIGIYVRIFRDSWLNNVQTGSAWEAMVRDDLHTYYAVSALALSLVLAGAATLRFPGVGIWKAAITAGLTTAMLMFVVDWSALIYPLMSAEILNWLMDHGALPFERTDEMLYNLMIFPGFLLAGLIAALAAAIIVGFGRPKSLHAEGAIA